MTATPEFFTLQEAVAGRYSIVGELGRGGMGIVFLARDVALDRPVAIKMLPPELAASRAHRDRFLREARIAARLSHPHIVPIHSVEEHPSAVFFVMGFVEGETLAARVARQGPLTHAEATRIVQEVAWALAHAHASGVIHRDVKPDNILLERGTGRVLVTDFGIARRDDGSDSSGEGRVVGTPRYMSPEQAAGDQVDERSDLYSLGAVAFFAVTARPPFDGSTAVSVMAKHVTAPPPRVSDRRPDLPTVLADAIDKCLAKAPAARFACAEDLAVTLRAIGLGVAEVAAPVRMFTREADSASTQIASLATAVGAALVGFGYSYLFEGDNIFDLIEAVLYLGIAAAMTSLIAVRATQLALRAREAVKAGYGHSAISSGLLLEQQNAANPGHHRPGVLAGLACAGISAFGVWAASTDTFLPALLGIAVSIGVPTLFVSRLTSIPSGRGSWLSRMIRGKLGKLAIRLAALGLKDRPQLKPSAGEPTAVALSHAVADLFMALPEAQRRDLADLPALVARLEAQALAMRDRTPNPSQDEGFVTAVAALETLRLDLLRMHASAGSRDDLTRHLEAARHIGAEISLQLRARAELTRTPQ